LWCYGRKFWRAQAHGSDVKPVLPQVALAVFFGLEFDTLVHQQVASP